MALCCAATVSLGLPDGLLGVAWPSIRGEFGLALDATGIAFVMRNFPSLCSYDADEVEELVTFLLRPLPEPGAFPSVAMVADGSRFGGDGADVDCEFLRGCCPTPRIFGRSKTTSH